MKRPFLVRPTLAASLLFAGVVAGLVPSASAATTSVAVYDSIGPVVPGNVPSQPFQAQQVSEIGDRVVLAAGPRYLRSVTVLMSSWGCQTGTWNSGDCTTTVGATFNHDLTMTIYAPPSSGLGVGAKLVTTTQNFAIPFRPSASTSCTGDNAGKWFDGTTCSNGYATPVTFTFDGTVLLPSDLIWGISFNTSGYGATPMGFKTTCAQSTAGCGYDSLNVGLAGVLTTGTDYDTNGAYLNTTSPASYCDGGAGGSATFRSDTLVGPDCWRGYLPMARIATSDETVDPPPNNTPPATSLSVTIPPLLLPPTTPAPTTTVTTTTVPPTTTAAPAAPTIPAADLAPSLPTTPSVSVLGNQVVAAAPPTDQPAFTGASSGALSAAGAVLILAGGLLLMAAALRRRQPGK